MTWGFRLFMALLFVAGIGAAFVCGYLLGREKERQKWALRR